MKKNKEKNLNRKSQLSQAEQMLFNTIKIVSYCDNKETGSGTGFFYTITAPNNSSTTLLITNNHVIENSDRIKIKICLADHNNTHMNKREFADIDLILKGGGCATSRQKY